MTLKSTRLEHCIPISDLEKTLVLAGVNPTAQRLAIGRYVLCEARHPTADEVKAWADRILPKVSLATVYNTLGVLVKAGLLREVRLPHVDSVLYDNHVSFHHHFLDERTGEVMDVNPGDIQVRSKLKKHFKINAMEVLLKGVRQKT